MTTWISLNGRTGDSQLPERTVAGAVLQAARNSAGLSREQLAAQSGVSDETLHAWEIGAEPLASLPVAQLDGLKDLLSANGADEEVIADLDVAIWCDIVLAAIAEHDELSCLLADPLAGAPSFGELLGWAVSGTAPARYGKLASARALGERREQCLLGDGD